MSAGLSLPVRMTEVRILENLADGVPISEALSRVCDYIDDESPGAVSAVLMLDESEMQFRLVAGPRAPAPLSKAIDGLRAPPCAGTCGMAPRQGRPVTVWDLRSDSLFSDRRDMALSSGFTAAWSLPIWSTNRDHLGDGGRFSSQLSVRGRRCSKGNGNRCPSGRHCHQAPSRRIADARAHQAAASIS